MLATNEHAMSECTGLCEGVGTGFQWDEEQVSYNRWVVTVSCN